MAVELKLTGNLKELLKVQGATDESLNMVDGYFNEMAQTLVEHSQEQQTEQKAEGKPLSTLQMARKARVINPMKTEASGSLLEMARAARIIK